MSAPFFRAKVALLLPVLLVTSLATAQVAVRQKKDSLIALLPGLPDDSNKVKVYCKLAVLSGPDDRDEAISYNNKSIALARHIRWRKGIANAWNDRSIIYFYAGDFGQALQYSRSALDIYRELDFKKGMATAHTSMGNAYEASGYHAEAIKSFYAALPVFEALGMKDAVSKIHLNLGASYSKLKDYPQSIAHYEKALALSRETGNAYDIASVLDNLGSTYYLMQQYDRAEAYYRQAAPFFIALAEQYALAKTYNNMGNVYNRKQQMDSAYHYYMRSLQLNEAIKDSVGMAYNFGGLGELYASLSTDAALRQQLPRTFFNSSRKALERQAAGQFAKALDIVRSKGNIELIASYAESLSQMEARLGDTGKAFLHYQLHTLFKDSIFNDENRKKIAALEMNRLAGLKNKEIVLLKKDKELQAIKSKQQQLVLWLVIGGLTASALLTLLLFRAHNRRRKAALELQVSETELQVLRLQMNPHFIFNALHAINKYLLDNDKEKASAFLSQFSGLMRLTLEYSAEQEIPLIEDLEALELYLQLESLRFKNRFRYCIEVAPEIDPEHTLIPPLLLQPFVENAILHGLQQKEGGQIQIHISKENEMLHCSIKDNGSGRQKTVADAAGVKRKSMGIRITGERLRMIAEMKKVKTAIHFLDLKDEEEQPAGLLVSLTLPYSPAY